VRELLTRHAPTSIATTNRRRLLRLLEETFHPPKNRALPTVNQAVLKQFLVIVEELLGHKHREG
jgi:hypothetical protein